jgi:crotonobetainyl-CoA:carnitine CoA-transferase CaiB-like acyl-CoA transferase
MRRRLPFVIVPSMAELLAEPVHRGRAAFETVRIGDAAFEAPVLPLRLTRTPPAADGRAPLAGTDSWRPAPPRVFRRDRREGGAGLPLAGVRVVVRAYASALEQASGLPSVTGHADGPPTMNHIAYGGPIGGLNVSAALLAALLHRRRTGQGQHVNLSQVECILPLVAPWIIEQSITGAVAPRLGNRHPVFVPHGCFGCAGDDGWVVIAVTGDAA